MAEAKTRNGHGTAKGRLHRTGPQQQQADLQTVVEDEMLASGHHSVVPHTGVIGAHRERVIGRSGELDSDVDLPPAPGSDVAPSQQAAERERLRHQLESELGHIPAGSDGRIRQQSNAAVSREALDRAAVRADEMMKEKASGSFPAVSAADAVRAVKAANAVDQPRASASAAGHADRPLSLGDRLVSLAGFLIASSILGGVAVVKAVRRHWPGKKDSLDTPASSV